MEIIVQLIAEEIKVVEFQSPNPKFFRCGNTFFFGSGFVVEHNIILAVFAFEESHINLQEYAILTF